MANYIYWREICFRHEYTLYYADVIRETACFYILNKFDTNCYLERKFKDNHIYTNKNKCIDAIVNTIDTQISELNEHKRRLLKKKEGTDNE